MLHAAQGRPFQLQVALDDAIVYTLKKQQDPTAAEDAYASLAVLSALCQNVNAFDLCLCRGIDVDFQYYRDFGKDVRNGNTRWSEPLIPPYLAWPSVPTSALIISRAGTPSGQDQVTLWVGSLIITIGVIGTLRLLMNARLTAVNFALTLDLVCFGAAQCLG